MTAQGQRETWVDNVKALACALVVIGHFEQSMVRVGILPAGDFYGWFQMTIYSFHVPLFFICSGYLYQRYSRVNSLSSWWGSVTKKLLSLGVPYMVFTLVTLGMKVLAADDVNSPAANPLMTLFIQPISPYWFLYTLLILFVITPTVRNDSQSVWMLVLALILKVLSLMGVGEGLPFAISSVMERGVWFVAGMGLCSLGWVHRLGKVMFAFGLLSLPISMLVYTLALGSWAEFVLGCLACTCVLSGALEFSSKEEQPSLLALCARFTLPVFLMHTIFAAGMRVLLLRLGIEIAFVHIVAGLAASFVCPAITMIFLEKLRPLDFFVYPNRYIRAFLRKGPSERD